MIVWVTPDVLAEPLRKKLKVVGEKLKIPVKIFENEGGVLGSGYGASWKLTKKVRAHDHSMNLHGTERGATRKMVNGDVDVVDDDDDDDDDDEDGDEDGDSHNVGHDGDRDHDCDDDGDNNTTNRQEKATDVLETKGRLLEQGNLDNHDHAHGANSVKRSIADVRKSNEGDGDVTWRHEEDMDDETDNDWLIFFPHFFLFSFFFPSRIRCSFCANESRER